MDMKIEKLSFTDSKNGGIVTQIEIHSGWMWVNNCFGDAFTHVTIARMVNPDNGKRINSGIAVKHHLDEFNPAVGRTVALTKLFKREFIPKHVRTAYWAMIGEKKK